MASNTYICDKPIARGAAAQAARASSAAEVAGPETLPGSAEAAGAETSETDEPGHSPDETGAPVPTPGGSAVVVTARAPGAGYSRAPAAQLSAVQARISKLRVLMPKPVASPGWTAPSAGSGPAAELALFTPPGAPDS